MRDTSFGGWAGAGRRKSFMLFDGSQAWPSRPYNRKSIKMETLR